MKKTIRIPDYNLLEELINSISHGIGAILSIIGLIILVIKALSLGILYVILVTIFGATMILLYFTSFLYHITSNRSYKKQILRMIDHINVYLLVFGTIIPVAFLSIKGIYGFILFSIVLISTVIGIIITIKNIDNSQKLSVICHLINGWGVLLFIKYLLPTIGINGILLILLGGIMYSLGAILYLIGAKIRYMHSIFHIFCLLGTMFHYLAIYFYVLK